MTETQQKHEAEPEYPYFGTLVWRSDEDGCKHLVAQGGISPGLGVAFEGADGSVTDITDQVFRMVSPALGDIFPAWYVPGPGTAILTLGGRTIRVAVGSPW